MQHLADNLRSARKAAGLNVEGLAAAAGVSYSTIVRTEAGAQFPNIRTLAAIAEALAMPVDELLRERVS